MKKWVKPLQDAKNALFSDTATLGTLDREKTLLTIAADARLPAWMSRILDKNCGSHATSSGLPHDKILYIIYNVETIVNAPWH